MTKTDAAILLAAPVLFFLGSRCYEVAVALKEEPSIDPFRRAVLAEYGTPELVAVTMGEEAHVGADGLLCPLKTDLPGCIKMLNPFEVALHAERRRLLELDVIGVYPILTEVHALKYGPDETFLRIQVELKPLLHEVPDLLHPFVKLSLVIGEHDDVVHVADIIVNPELPLRVVIDDILIHICEHLIQEAPHGEPLVREHLVGGNVLDALPRRETELLAGGIDKQVHEPHEPRVEVALPPDQVERNLMVDSVEKLARVDLREIAPLQGAALEVDAGVLFRPPELLHEVKKALRCGI